MKIRRITLGKLLMLRFFFYTEKSLREVELMLVCMLVDQRKVIQADSCR